MARKTNKSINGSSYFRVTCFEGFDEKGKRKYKEFYGKTKAEAVLKKEQFITSGRLEGSKEQLGHEIYEWLTTVIKSTGIKPGTFDRYITDYEQGIKESEISWMKLQNIKSIQIQNYYNSMAENGKTYNQILRTHKMLKRFFNYALSQDKVIKNPCMGVIIPDQVKQEYKSTKKVVEIFKKEEVDKIIKVAFEKNPIYACIITLLAKFGAREGEILGLTYDSLDDTRIEINKTLRKIKNHDDGTFYLHLDTAKTKDSIRTIYFSEDLKFLFKKANSLQNEQKIKNPDYNNNLNLIFTTESGSPIEARNFLRFWKKLLVHAEIEYRPPHTLRHTFISECARLKIDKKVCLKDSGGR